MQRGTPRAKQKKTQGKVAYEMPELPDVVMHHREAGQVHSHQEVK